MLDLAEHYSQARRGAQSARFRLAQTLRIEKGPGAELSDQAGWRAVF